MGRYCYGDIDHKFYFGLQASDSADRFGGRDEDYLYYCYDGLDSFDLVELDELIEQYERVTNKEIDIDNTPIDELYTFLSKEQREDKALLLLVADIELGLKIYRCIKEQGYCRFKAEL